MPTQKQKTVNISVEDLLNKVTLSDKPDIYSNHIQVSISSNEMFLDFYYISPISGKQPKITHVQRVVAPVAMTKGLASALANIVAQYEDDHNVTLPTSRETQPEDKITIWP